MDSGSTNQSVTLNGRCSESLALLLLLGGLLRALTVQLGAASLGTAFSYQGQLTDGGAPANGRYDFLFRLYDAPAGVNPIGPLLSTNAMPVNGGQFTLELDFGAAAFTGDVRWLEIAVRTNATGAFSTLSPRQPLMAAPYALFASNAGAAHNAFAVAAGVVSNLNLASGAVTSEKIADGSIAPADLNPALASSTFWRLDGNRGTTPRTHFIGTTDLQPLEFRSGGQAALRLQYATNAAERPEVSINVNAGYWLNQIGGDAVGATIAGGGGQIREGFFDRILWNTVASSFATVSGGVANRIEANAQAATIAGGWGNEVHSDAGFATIGGGSENAISNSYAAVIGGGGDNWIQGGDFGVVSGGCYNQVTGERRAFVSGRPGEFNAIGGGGGNFVQNSSQAAYIGGGLINEIQTNSSYTTIGGGYRNLVEALADYATIGGGDRNKIQTDADHATIAGGRENTIQPGDFFATISGGWGNQATNVSATVGGGFANLAGGLDSTVPGGNNNTANGNYSLAAGRRAKANHLGTFVWADSTDADFTSTAPNQFLIRAAGGVGIGGAPSDALLDVKGDVRINERDLLLRSGTDRNHGLGWYGGGKPFAGVSVDGPVLYGWSGGGLGVTSGDRRLVLSWDGNGNVVLDPGNSNNGTLWPGLCFGAGSGEGIASKRTAGGNQYSLSFHTAFTERMTILNNGRVGIGRTPTANALEVAGDASKISAGAWLANSDARIKTDIAPVTNAIETLAKVRLVRFRYTDEYQAHHPGVENRPYLNVVAQEFAEVFPEYVKSSGETLADGSAILQVDPHPLTIYSAAAIQELNQKVEARTKELEIRGEEAEARSRKLEERNAALEREVTELKSLVKTLAEMMTRGGR